MLFAPRAESHFAGVFRGGLFAPASRKGQINLDVFGNFVGCFQQLSVMVLMVGHVTGRLTRTTRRAFRGNDSLVSQVAFWGTPFLLTLSDAILGGSYPNAVFPVLSVG